MKKKTLFTILGVLLIVTLSACSLLDSIKSLTGGSSSGSTDSNVLFQDDFASNTNDWDEWSDTDGTIEFTDGAYQITVNTANMDIWGVPGKSFSDLSIEVDATKVGGPDNNDFGVICRYQDTNNFYFGYLASDGYYAVGKLVEGEYTVFGGGDMTYTEEVISGNSTNHIRFDCVGDTLTLYANGTQLGSYQDSDYTSGDIGLVAGTFEETGTQMQFDNLVVSKP